MDFTALYLRYKFWLNDFLTGSPIGTPYKEIKYISEHSINQCSKIREEKLHSILKYAIKYSSFYKNLPSLELCYFPVMNKTKYLKYFDEIKIPERFIPGQKGKIHMQTTSGSTGTPFAVPQDTLKRQRRIAELKYFGKLVGFNTHEKLIHLRTWNKWQQKTAKQIKSENIIPFDISNMSDTHIAELCKLIKKEHALCLRGYASSFDILAKFVAEHPNDFPSLKICIAGSESLLDDVRENVKKTLKCEIISQYANEECGILAQERIPTKSKDNIMYLNNASYFFEFLKIDSDEPAQYGELARIVITDLHNHAFPIIRYDCGDVGILAPPNKYSNGYPVLQKLYGRRLDVCYTTENKPFSPMAIGRIIKHFDKIIQWQFIQKGKTEYTLKMIIKKENLPNNYFNPIVEELKTILGKPAHIKIEQVNEIPILASGKRKPVINEWKNGK